MQQILSEIRDKFRTIRQNSVLLTRLQTFPLHLILRDIRSSELNNAKDSIIQSEGSFIAVNLTLSTFPCTILRSLLLGGGVNSSPGQLAIALSSMGLRV